MTGGFRHALRNHNTSLFRSIVLMREKQLNDDLSTFFLQHRTFVGCQQRQAAEECNQTQITTGSSSCTHFMHIQSAGKMGGCRLPRWLHTNLGPQKSIFREYRITLHANLQDYFQAERDEVGTALRSHVCIIVVVVMRDPPPLPPEPWTPLTLTFVGRYDRGRRSAFTLMKQKTYGPSI